MSDSHEAELVVIGGGFAGVIAAIEAARAGVSTCLIKGNPGASALSSGMVAGQHLSTLADFDASQTQALPPTIEAIPHTSIATSPVLLADTWSRLYQVCAAQPSQLRGDIRALLSQAAATPQSAPLIGIVQYGYHKASPDPASQYTHVTGIPCLDIELPLPHQFLSPFQIAAWFEHRWPSDTKSDKETGANPEPNLYQSWIQKLQATVKEHPSLKLVLFPPVLGIQKADEICDAMTKEISVACGELLANTPSVPGFRLQCSLEEMLSGAPESLQVLEGLASQPQTITHGKYQEVQSCQVIPPGSDTPVVAKGKEWILATGSWTGGGLTKDGPGPGIESLFRLPLHSRHANGQITPLAPSQRAVTTERLAHQALLGAGLRIDDKHLITDRFGLPIFTNVRATGAVVSSTRQYALHEVAIHATKTCHLAAEALKTTKTTENTENHGRKAC